jgi:hypothetical protein
MTRRTEAAQKNNNTNLTPARRAVVKLLTSTIPGLGKTLLNLISRQYSSNLQISSRSKGTGKVTKKEVQGISDS